MHTNMVNTIQPLINGAAPVAPAVDLAPAIPVEAGETGVAPPAPSFQQRVDHYREITLVRRQLSSVRATDTAVAALLTARGVTPDYLTSLETQLGESEASVDFRQEAIAAEQAAIARVESLFADAWRSLSVLRQVGRAAALDEAAHTKLHLDEPLPRSMDLFLPLARRSLSAAQQTPYATLLAEATYTAESVTTALAQVDALEVAVRAREQAHQVALAARQARDRNICALRRAMRPLRVQMKAILHSHPEMVRPAGF